MRPTGPVQSPLLFHAAKRHLATRALPKPLFFLQLTGELGCPQSSTTCPVCAIVSVPGHIMILGFEGLEVMGGG